MRMRIAWSRVLPRSWSALVRSRPAVSRSSRTFRPSITTLRHFHPARRTLFLTDVAEAASRVLNSTVDRVALTPASGRFWVEVDGMGSALMPRRSSQLASDG